MKETLLKLKKYRFNSLKVNEQQTTRAMRRREKSVWNIDKIEWQQTNLFHQSISSIEKVYLNKHHQFYGAHRTEAKGRKLFRPLRLLSRVYHTHSSADYIFRVSSRNDDIDNLSKRLCCIPSTMWKKLRFFAMDLVIWYYELSWPVV